MDARRIGADGGIGARDPGPGQHLRRRPSRHGAPGVVHGSRGPCGPRLAAGLPADGIDQDCDGVEDCYLDADDDGYRPDASSLVSGGSVGCAGAGEAVATDPIDDCNDADPTVHPGATETCNVLDDDCDGAVDEDAADAATLYADTDADAYGAAASTTTGCAAPAGYVADATDCDDTRADVNPGAPEVCDAADTDEDCDGLADDADPSTDPAGMSTRYTDGDGDGYGDPGSALTACDPPAALVADATDCDDTNPTIHPGAPDPAGDGIDQDCDGVDTPGDSGDTGDTADSADSAAADSAAADSDSAAVEDTGKAVGSGCGCAATSPTGPWSGFALLAVVAVARRRRSSSPPPFNEGPRPPPA